MEQPRQGRLVIGCIVGLGSVPCRGPVVKPVAGSRFLAFGCESLLQVQWRCCRYCSVLLATAAAAAASSCSKITSFAVLSSRFFVFLLLLVSLSNKLHRRRERKNILSLLPRGFGAIVECYRLLGSREREREKVNKTVVLFFFFPPDPPIFITAALHRFARSLSPPTSPHIHPRAPRQNRTISHCALSAAVFTGPHPFLSNIIHSPCFPATGF